MNNSPQTLSSNWNSDLSVWLSVDPLSDKYPHVSSYCYVENNPIMRIDPDGRDWYQVLTSEGMQDKNSQPIFFEGSGHREGYINIGSSVLSIDPSGNQRSYNADGSITNSRLLPEVTVGGGNAQGQGGYSGDNIFLETWSHYQIGGRKDINVSTSSLDFSFVSKKNLVYNSKDNTYSVNLFILNKLSQTSLALGRVSLNSIGNNRYTINRDYYDFNIEWSQGFSTRNIGTFGAGLIHGPVIDNIPMPLPIFPFFGPSVYTGSGPYWINFSGSVYIKP